MTSSVSIVIPAFNGADFICELLESVFAQTLQPKEIIVVDDASTDCTPDIIDREFPRVTLVRKTTNEGFSATCNRGIQLALDSSAEYVWLLNQDLRLHPDCLEQLTSTARASPEFGLVSAFQLAFDGQSIDPLFRGYMPLRFWDDLVLGAADSIYAARFMPAAAVLLRRDMLFEVGGFDPLFFMYGEDQDLCRRILSHGWKIGVVPAARVQHWHSVINCVRTYRWHCNFEYSRALLHLKSSPRPLPIAFLSLPRNLGADKSWLHCLARIPAFIRCVYSARRISLNRAHPPHSFNSILVQTSQRMENTTTDTSTVSNEC